MVCPCGSGRRLDDCCGRYHRGAAAPSAEVLMRSRYSAYVLKNSHYLRQTWHPATCPPELEISNDDIHWQQLLIVDTQAGGEGDSEGAVEFVAAYQGGQLHERSRFSRSQGRWCYLDGEQLPPLKFKPTGRNTPCPCGSGRKYKHCCGR
jgi:SEC-C motif-containing protein